MEEQGVHRGEVFEIMGALADLKTDVGRIVRTSRTARMKKKRKIFRTPEERAAWKAAHEARLRSLQGHIDRIKAELAGKSKPA